MEVKQNHLSYILNCGVGLQELWQLTGVITDLPAHLVGVGPHLDMFLLLLLPVLLP